MRAKFVALAVVALMGVGSFASARADVLFDNTTQTPISYDPIVSYPSGAGPTAASFSVGAQGLDLGSLTAVLQGAGPGVDPGTIDVQLFTGSSAPGGVGVSIGTIDAGSLAAGYDSVSVALTASVALSSNQRYWIELSSSGLSPSGLTGWAYDGNNAGTGVAGEYTWNNYTSGGSTYSNDISGYAYLMQVEAVPEPASLGLVAVGLVALMVARKGARAPA